MNYKWCESNLHFKATIVCNHNLRTGKCIKTRKGCKVSNFYDISDEERAIRSERMSKYHHDKENGACPE